MRAVASAILFLILNLIGLGLGPFFTGVMSDLLVPAFGEDSLRYALMITTCFAFWSAFHYWKASKYLREDLDNYTRTRNPRLIIDICQKMEQSEEIVNGRRRINSNVISAVALFIADQAC